jgi:sigma-54 dependent transcriptional regulator, acetoin dehydrogenase operon transcriptional activator AcoR
MSSRDSLMPEIEALPFGVVGEDIVASVLDSMPCGVLVLDRQRRIRRVNEAFRRALGITDSDCIGSCQGSVLGCLHAVDEHPHHAPSVVCEECELAALATRAFEDGDRVRGRATLQVATDGRLREVTFTTTAIPATVAGEDFVIVLIESLSELHELRPVESDAATFGMVGRDTAMHELYDLIREVGPLQVPVLILGESGTGKELVAQALHRVSERHEGLMVPVHCSALPEDLLESELFGHVRGAFTGAHRDRQGRFELADGGTIFLDEIGELSPAMQVKLLRVLQDGSFDPVGGERTVTVDARVVCATNRDLEADVANGRFRSDLYYRLCVVPITVPPLRERANDIPLLAAHFLARFARAHADAQATLSEEAIEALVAHRWPGNVRELENAVQYAAIRSRGGVIRSHHLPPNLEQPRSGSSVGRPPIALDREGVRRALLECNGNRRVAAARLGVSRTTLWRFLKANPEDDPTA